MENPSIPQQPTSKYLFVSKTVILNLLLGLGSLIPHVAEFVAAHPQESLAVIGLANGLLRLITRDRIELYRDNPAAEPVPQPEATKASAPKAA